MKNEEIYYDARVDEDVFFVVIENDDSGENPASGENDECVIHSLGTRHTNHNPHKIESIIKKYKGAKRKPYVMLSYYEHGNCVWSIRGEGPKCEFDSVDTAGLFYAGKVFIKENSKVSDEEFNAKLMDYARQTCTEYTAWCNGSIYKYTIYKARYDKEIDTDFFEYQDQDLLEEMASLTGIAEYSNACTLAMEDYNTITSNIARKN